MADESGIIILNVPKVAGALDNYPQIARPEYQAATEASLLLVAGALAEYPSAPPASEYVRTGTLGREWTTAGTEFQASASGFEGRIGNNTPYGPYVQSAERQARVHRGRWKTDRQAAEQNKARIEGNYRAAVKRIEEAINKVTS